jgi:hypothetical protein
VILYFELFKGTTLFQCNGPAETTGEVVYEKFDSVRDFQAKRVLGRVTLGSSGYPDEFLVSIRLI